MRIDSDRKNDVIIALSETNLMSLIEQADESAFGMLLKVRTTSMKAYVIKDAVRDIELGEPTPYQVSVKLSLASAKRLLSKLRRSGRAWISIRGEGVTLFVETDELHYASTGGICPSTLGQFRLGHPKSENLRKENLLQRLVRIIFG